MASDKAGLMGVPVLGSIEYRITEVNMSGLKTIDIDELKVGMYVVEFVRQKGELAIKNSGTIQQLSTIERLISNGVTRLIIDPMRSQSARTGGASSLETVVDPSIPNKPAAPDLAAALQLHSKGISLQKLIHESVKKRRPLDTSYVSDFTELMINMIESNPNAMGCAARIRKKDSYLLEHALNVSIHLIHLGQHMNMSIDDVHDLGVAGLLIDVGKICIPDEILFKAGNATPHEKEIIRGHVKLGEEYLQQHGYPEKIINVVAQHHERLDGSGYPRKLVGVQIHEFGRMVAIVDTYDAITADRPYRLGITHQHALKVLLAESQTKLDSTIVQHFIKCMGIFPEGTLVELSNGHVAMVCKENRNTPLHPTVKPFYSIKSKHYLSVKEIDLARIQNIKIVRQVKASQFDIDFHKVFHENMV
ncbi:HD-GYP domain-containing protein [Alteromonas ponticola]|uniref:HD-GYP domain-containing protein n=1 Tax=Alteromonas ponticola TaxID=2720613 RepID=A0ABX1R4H6_9ALTE|nr:HD-GYP domain-containing protein [Alteromonas ponticola]NMH60556.1 HD-GYP domain-containing protein [Alteromonas ponticola]